MILEIAMLDVIPLQTKEFEKAFAQAQQIIIQMPGYVTHELQRCLEKDNRYALLITWQSLEDHTIAFRQSKEYQEWKKLLHHFYHPFPVVEHFEKVNLP